MAGETAPTEEEFASWLPPSGAISEVSKAMGDWTKAAEAILERLKAGLIIAYAENFSEQTIHHGVDTTSPLKPMTIIPSAVWVRWTDFHFPGGMDFWTTNDGVLKMPGTYPHPTKILRYFGIRFEPKGVRKLAPQKLPKLISSPVVQPAQIAPMPPPNAPASVAPALRAGRPSKDFWEDMVIAATRAILYDDTLKPKTQADVQRWMADWAMANGHGHPGDTALKERARKVFLACRE